MAHLVGNNDHVRRLLQWLNSWEAENAAANARAGDKAAKGAPVFNKAALLSGPPGVGKTSTAKVILAQAGYDIVELNASDTRSEKSIKSMANDMVSNTSIADFATAAGSTPHAAKNGRMALIMDEVDGMSSGDRGGMSMLIKIIHTSKMPVICICNDRQSQKVKSLANHCLDLRFRRPATGEIKSALRRVVAAEGYHGVDDAILDKLVEACNADIRQMLNLLQIWRPKEGAAALTSAGVGESLKCAFKDLDVGPFDIADKFFRPGFSMEQQLRHYFVDSSMTPLLVMENYPSVHPFVPQHVPPNKRALYELDRLDRAANMIAQADIVQSAIMSQQQWALAPLAGALSCYGPGLMMRGNGPGRVQFPMWLGRNSTATKRQRLLKEVAGHMAHKISASKHEVRASYMPAMRPRLLEPLTRHGADGAEAVLEQLDEYNLSKDDFDSMMEFELLSGPNAKAAFAAVPTAAKSALTRLYNKRHADITKMKKGARGAGGGEKTVRYTEDGEEEDMIEDDDEEEGSDDDFAPAAKPAAASSKAAGKQPAAKGKGKGKAKM